MVAHPRPNCTASTARARAPDLRAAVHGAPRARSLVRRSALGSSVEGARGAARGGARAAAERRSGDGAAVRRCGDEAHGHRCARARPRSWARSMASRSSTGGSRLRAPCGQISHLFAVTPQIRMIGSSRIPTHPEHRRCAGCRAGAPLQPTSAFEDRSPSRTTMLAAPPTRHRLLAPLVARPLIERSTSSDPAVPPTRRGLPSPSSIADPTCASAHVSCSHFS